jgi:CPA2 family monovalent cation:H+ antiporter-2
LLDRMLTILAAASGGHGAEVIHDLGVVVAAAATVAVIFYRLKIPSIFGYLLAGLLLGGDLGLPSPVLNFGVIQQLSELGVIFLLFFIGMEFDLRRLREMFWPALLALSLQTITMLYLAYGFAAMLGWSSMEALFLGSLLAISSSMVTVRVLRDQNRMNLPHAQLAVGILIMEDILAVVLLVILTGTAVNQQFDWGAAWLVIFFMGVFVFAVFVLGRILAPRVLHLLFTDDDNREVITVFSVGLVLGISLFALRLDFSPALGAFIAGAILSQTRFVHSLESIHRTLHDLFSAVFFVTVGMLMKPTLMLANIGWVLLLAALVIVGKVASCWLGMFLAGQAARTSFRAGVAKGQIGEFSFIIAGLGLSLVGESEGMRQMANIAYGVAFVTILLTPVFTSRSAEAFAWLSTIAPPRIKRFGNFYHDLIEQIVGQLGKSRVLGILRQSLGRIAGNFLLLNAVLLIGFFAAQYFRDQGVFGATYTEWALLGLWMLIALGLAPFLFAIIGNLNQIVFKLTDAVFESRAQRPILQGRMRNLFLWAELCGQCLCRRGLLFLLRGPVAAGQEPLLCSCLLSPACRDDLLAAPGAFSMSSWKSSLWIVFRRRCTISRRRAGKR